MTTGQKELPVGWKRVKLGDACEFLDSKRIPIKEADRSLRISGKSENELYPYYGANGQVGCIDGYLFDEPTILLAEDGGHFGSKERPIAYKVQDRYWVNNHAHVLKPKDNFDFDFLFHSIEIRPDVGNLVQGATRAKLNLSTAKQIPIALPPLEEQKRIAGILNKAEEIKKLRKEADKKTEELITAIFHEMVGSHIKKGEELPAGWKWVKLGDVCEIARGGSPRPIQNYLTNSEDGVNWVKIGDATASNKYIYTTQEKITKEGADRSRAVHEGDFLLSNSMSYGHPYIMGTSGYIHDGWLVLRRYEASFNQDFLYYLLGSPSTYTRFESLSAGSTVKNLNIQLVSNIPIPLPPLEEQKRIVDRLNGAEKIRKTNAESGKKIEELKSSLLQRAFRGEL